MDVFPIMRVRLFAGATRSSPRPDSTSDGPAASAGSFVASHGFDKPSPPSNAMLFGLAECCARLLRLVFATGGTRRRVGPRWGRSDALRTVRNSLLSLWVLSSAASAQSLATADRFDLSGGWFEPATSGQGLMVEVLTAQARSGNALLFAGWFTYTGTSGGVAQQEWYTLQGDLTPGGTSFALGIFRSGVGRFDATPVVTATNVGAATLTFHSCTSATLAYTFNSANGGRTGRVDLVRLAANVSCTEAGTVAQAPTPFLNSGAFFRPETAGQGFFLEYNPTTRLLFGAWYTYTRDGAATPGRRWYTLQKSGADVAASVIDSVGIFETTGGVFDTPGPVNTRQVGVATVRSLGCRQVEVAYRFTAGELNGAAGTQVLERVVSVPTQCRSVDTVALTSWTVNVLEQRTALRGAPNVAGAWATVSAPGPLSVQNPSSPTTLVAFVAPGVYEFEYRSSANGGVLARNRVTVTPNAFVATATSRPTDHLRNLAAPVFRNGHAMQPIGSAAIQMHPNLLKELADRWGWGIQTGINLEYCDPNPNNAQGAPDRGFSHNDEALRLMEEGAGRYKLILGTSNLLPGQNVATDAWLEGSLRRGVSIPEAVWMNTQNPPLASTRIGGNRPVITPLAPADWVRARGADAGRCLSRFTQIRPVSVIADAAEYGPSVWSGAYCAAVMDARLLAAVGYPSLAGSPYENCGTRIPNSAAVQDRDRKLARFYLRKVTELRQNFKAGLVDGVRWSGVPFISFYGDSYGTDRGRWGGWDGYGQFLEDQGAEKLSTASSPEHYYGRFNSGFTGINALGTPSDITTYMLNNVGGSIRNGVTTFYPWISSGWGNPALRSEVAERERWMGFLKVMYTAGAVGNLSGWFDYTRDFEQQTVRNAPVGTTIPVWLEQHIDAAQAHALFSHLEPYLRNGDLVQGATHQGITTHPYNQDPVNSPPVPYFALRLTGEWRDAAPNTVSQGQASATGGPQAFVMARKMRGQSRWVITAWANVGGDRDVTAQLPGYGALTLRARVAGSVYLGALDGSGRMQLQLLDEVAMQPSALMFP